VTQSPWRIAAGACLLAVGVMTAGGQLAHADSGSPSSQEAGESSTAAQGDSNPGDPSSPSKQPRTTLRDAATTLGNGRNQLTQSLTGPTASIKSSVATLARSIVGVTRVNRTVTVPIGRRQQPDAPADVVAPPSPSAAASASSAAVPRVASPLTSAIASAVARIAPASNPAATTTPTTPTTVQSPVAPVTDLVAETLSELAAPIPDVIATLQFIVTSTTHALVAPLAQLPTNLASLLGITAMPSVTGSVVGGASASAGGDTVGLLLQIVQPPSGTLGTAALDPIGAPTPLQISASPFDLTSALGHTPSAAANVRVVPDDAGASPVQAFLKSYGGLVAVAASLAALVAAAFPGLVGLFIPTAAGARIGYRQAKARMAMRTSRIARFSAVGPIGIVRSGALVTLRPNSTYVAPVRAGNLSQNVA